jgi:hypothetical protein
MVRPVNILPGRLFKSGIKMELMRVPAALGVVLVNVGAQASAQNLILRGCVDDRNRFLRDG